MGGTQRSHRLALRRRSRRWALAFVGASVIAIVSFLLTSAIAGPVRPGDLAGLIYGSAAWALLILAFAYALRRRSIGLSARVAVGGARTWLWAHVYGSALFLVAMLLHSGVRLPTGTLTWSLWILGWWTVLSGLAGLALQAWIPRVLASGLSTEVNYDRLHELASEIKSKAADLGGAGQGPIKSLYGRTVAPVLDQPRRRMIYFFDVTGGLQSRLKEFDYLRGRLASEERDRLRDLERLLRTKLELDAHYTLQWALRTWLVLHLPPAIVLLALSFVHVWAVYWY